MYTKYTYVKKEGPRYQIHRRSLESLMDFNII
jgi:hypothetical protein